MKIAILGSGSSGNSILIESDDTKLLIDAGYSGKKIKEKMDALGRNLNEIDGLLITHEHGDHILGAGVLSRRYNIPIYITRESYFAVEEKLGKISNENLNFIDEDFKIKNLDILPFDVMHDAERTLGFRIEDRWKDKVVGIATDIGYATNIVKEKLKGLDALIIESNYDYNMLMACKYPWPLKARVKSNNGHLSNEDALNLINDIYSEKLKKVYFVHVSRDSNCYKLANENIVETLNKLQIDIDFELIEQEKTSDFYHVK